MSEQPKDHHFPDESDSATAPQQTWRVRLADPQLRDYEPAPADVVEGLRTLYG